MRKAKIWKFFLMKMLATTALASFQLLDAVATKTLKTIKNSLEITIS